MEKIEKHKITYTATYEVRDFSRPAWVIVAGKFNCNTEEEAIDAAMTAVIHDPQATGKWAVTEHQQCKQYCYSKQVAHGHLTFGGVVEAAI